MTICVMQAITFSARLSHTDRLVVMYVDVVIVVLFVILTYKFDWVANLYKSIQINSGSICNIFDNEMQSISTVSASQTRRKTLFSLVLFFFVLFLFFIYLFFSLVIVGCVCKPTGTDGNNLGCLVLPFIRVYFDWQVAC